MLYHVRRMDETADAVKPMFSGTRGEERERVCQKVERLFREALKKVDENSHNIFDIHHSMWNDDMFLFRNEMKDLEIIIENLVTSIFVKLNNVQEAMEDFQSFHSYMNRDKLKALFDSKTSEVSRIELKNLSIINLSIYYKYPSNNRNYLFFLILLRKHNYNIIFWRKNFYGKKKYRAMSNFYHKSVHIYS